MSVKIRQNITFLSLSVCLPVSLSLSLFLSVSSVISASAKNLCLVSFSNTERIDCRVPFAFYLCLRVSSRCLLTELRWIEKNICRDRMLYVLQILLQA